MKQTALTILLILVITPLWGQMGNVAFKSATTSFSTYKRDTTRTKKLIDAKTAIDLAMKDSAVTTTLDFWQLRGEIYENIAQELMKRRLQRAVDSANVPELKDNPTYQAYQSYEKAIGLSRNNKEAGATARSGLQEVMRSLNAEGQYAYDAGKYGAAYELYSSVLAGEALLEANDTTGLSVNAGRNPDQVYLAATSALKARMDEEAEQLLLELYDKGYKQPLVYRSLYKLKTALKEGEETVPESRLKAAYPYLLTGREFFPDDPDLLGLQLEHLEKTGQYQALVDVLNPAIEKAPEDIGLVETLGRAHDQLFQQAVEQEAVKEAKMRFEKAKEAYLKVLERQPEHFKVLLGMGTLFANKSALATRQLVELSGDFSEEGMKNYDRVKEEVYDLLEQALPYLQKAEAIDPNDTETLIALRQVYARQDKDNMVKEFRERLQNIMSGGRNESYFSQK